MEKSFEILTDDDWTLLAYPANDPGISGSLFSDHAHNFLNRGRFKKICNVVQKIL